MAHTTPQVDTGGRVRIGHSSTAIVVGSPDWYSWLEAATTFAFLGPSCRFTARNERPARAGGQGTTVHLYLPVAMGLEPHGRSY